MTKALRFHAVVRGKALPLPDLSQFEGKRVEVIVLEEEAAQADETAPPTAGAADNGDTPAGEPMIRRRIFGGLRGKVTIHGNFDDPQQSPPRGHPEVL